MGGKLVEPTLSTGGAATVAGIQNACRDVMTMHRAHGRAETQAHTADMWRIRAEQTCDSVHGEEWRGPYILAYTHAALAAARMLTDLN